MASTATERASELVDDFSHASARNCDSEIALYCGSGSTSAWYDQFYNSKAHRIDMLSELYSSAAAAYCKVGGTYYVVLMLDY